MCSVFYKVYFYVPFVRKCMYMFLLLATAFTFIYSVFYEVYLYVPFVRKYVLCSVFYKVRLYIPYNSRRKHRFYSPSALTGFHT